MFSGLFTTLLITVSFGFIFAAWLSYLHRDDRSAPLEMLEERHSMGEIDAETYLRMRNDLEQA
jgi:uncharacterized membrane protein